MGVEQLRNVGEIIKKPWLVFERVRAERNMRQGLPDVLIAAANLGFKCVAKGIEVWDKSLRVPVHYEIDSKDIMPFPPLNNEEEDLRGYKATTTIPATSSTPAFALTIAYAY